MIAARGALPIEIPTIDVQLEQGSAFDAAAARAREFDAVIFTSANAVKAVSGALERSGEGGRTHGLVSVAVGPSTARAAEAAGFEVVVVPERAFVAEGLLDAMLQRGVDGARYWFPRAAVARDVLVDGLVAAGATVEVTEAYRTVPRETSREALKRALGEGVDVITVASSFTAECFDALLDEDGRSRARRVPFASIGPLTSEAARRLGYSVAVEAPEATLDALAEALETWMEAART
jgi:uroporphyrinogen III methyltransferase/synthase